MPASSLPSPKSDLDDGTCHEVQMIVAEKIEKGVYKFKVRWKGYSSEFDTWEPLQNLQGCPRSIAIWRAKHPIPESTKKRKKSFEGVESDSFGTSEEEMNSDSAISRRRTRAANNRPMPGSHAYVRWRNTLTEEDIVCDHDHTDINISQRINFILKLRDVPGPSINLYNDVDSDPSPPVDFEFIPRYKMGKGVVDWIEENTAFWGGCTCSDNCKDSCSCRSEATYRKAYDRLGRVIVDNVNVIHECNERCSCSMACPNRVVQKGRQLPLEIFKTERKGWGLRCPEAIESGTFIDTYPGELITVSEAQERGERNIHIGCSYLFDLDKFSRLGNEDEDEGGSQAIQDSQQDEENGPVMDEKEIYVIDGQHCGGVARFINHSCDPNISIYCVTRERADYRLYDLAMFVNRDIKPYEELTFNYGRAVRGAIQDGDLPRNPCYCGSRKCLGYIW